MNLRQIECAVRAFQKDLNIEDARFQADIPAEVYDPFRAADQLGFTVDIAEEMGTYAVGDQRFQVAGMFDRTASRVTISRAFSREVMRFTMAHELGHAVLHAEIISHRDRPMDGWRQGVDQHPWVEREADYFAACYLMPQDAVIRRFQSSYRVRIPFILDDNSAFHLRRHDPASLLRRGDAREVAVALATARSFNSHFFHPLHKQFGVSVAAMARRLVELNLVDLGSTVSVADAEAPDGMDPPATPLFAPGFHEILVEKLDEIFVNPFSRSARRQELVEGLKGLISHLRKIGIKCTMWLDGSFTTTKLAPDDVDVVIFLDESDTNSLTGEARSRLNLLKNRGLMQSSFKCDVYVERVDDKSRQNYWLYKFGEGHGNEQEKGIPVLTITPPALL